MKQSILIVVGGALASLLAIPQMAAFFARARSESNTMRETDEIRQTFKLTPGTRVEISSIRGPVEIETSNADTAEILITRNADNLADLQSDKIAIENKAGRLIIRGETAPGGNKNRHVDHHATLKLPRDINLAINSISGPVQLADLNGQIEVSSVSGSVTLDKVTQQARFKSISGDVKIGQVGGPLDISSVSGSVKLDQVAHFANIQSVSGDVKITQATDSFDISSVSGTVSAVIAKLGTGGVHITSVSRQVELRFRNEVDAQFTANSISRDVSIDLPNVTIEDKSANSTRARIGAGGPPISVKSVSGGVRLMLDTQTLK
jgi:DUF4097 and DUF4098 domain-containing protein YvlB